MARARLTRPVVVASAALASACASACSTALPQPPLGPHNDLDTWVYVHEEPPEPAQVEEIPASPDPRAVWIDGSWDWKGKRWVWKQGSWQLPPPGAYYARPVLKGIPTAQYETPKPGQGGQLLGYTLTLMYNPGHWHLPGRVVEEFPVAASPLR
ncbi:MAG TPA: hypothetical protein PLI95_10110 [Polyangiaceae bacterium]|nr:hypothetical protein [Polyangiaceae bacterium]